ncbi:MAG: hypothetical protein EXX96DRAFT_567089 [Benjaminiella poitrasii]|nr:MAG: hypothetical protein EXX96DRAFT_567089 [Benjaminiella poitrasii]
MNFEDIVDMEWVDSHTTTDDYYLDQQNAFLLENPMIPQQQPQPLMLEPGIKMKPITSMPTTEQIKQLIEIAKKQLALREQLQQLQQQQQSITATTESTTIQIPHQPSLFHALTNGQTEMQTAAPSTIFAPPPPITTTASNLTPSTLPALSPSSITSTDMTLEPIKLEPIPENVSATSDKEKKTNKSNSTRRESLSSMPEESISLEAYAEADGIDLKKLTPKERRQLRNKISARNFRVRRKEYISTLEGQVNDHKMQAEALREKLMKVEDENKKLRKEMDYLKKQNQLLQQQLQSNEQQSKAANPAASPRISSPLPKPNLNKDISILGTKATESYRQQDNCILVSNAVMPVWDYSAILQKPPQVVLPDYVSRFVGQFLLSVVQLAKTMPCETTSNENSREQEVHKPLMPDERDFRTTTMKEEEAKRARNSPSMEDLYDILIQSSLINSNSVADKLFLW